MIKTYGLFWKTENVFWGRQNNPGELLGVKTKSNRARPVDFKSQQGIYALYSNYELVYVGQTGAGSNRLFGRLKAHLTDHLAGRWDQFSWFGTRWVTNNHILSADNMAIHEKTVSALNKLEAMSIAIAKPKLNLQGGRWGDAKQYFQYQR